MSDVRLFMSQFLGSWYGVASIRKGSVEVSNQQSRQDESKDVVKTEEYVKVQEVLKKLEIEKPEDLEQLLEGAFETIDEQNQELEDAEAAVGALLELKETYEFAYLNLYLVDRTKQALLLLYQLGSSTKELFAKSIAFDESVTDPELEREAICSALLAHELVEVSSSDSLYTPSDKGERFLKFVDLL